MKKLLKISLLSALFLIAVYVLLQFVLPSWIILKLIKVSFNNPARVDAVVYKNLRYLIFLGIIVSGILYLRQSSYWDAVSNSLSSFFKKSASYLNIYFLLGISIIYLVVLFYLAITHYDLGYDEAWYLYYAKNFAATGMPFWDVNGRIASIDAMTMLPYYLLSVINFKAGLTEVVNFKILAAALSVITLFVFFRVTEKFYNRRVATVSLFILISLSGFGFMASSFFGEFTQAAFLFGALYLWLKDPAAPGRRKIILISLLFALSIHTKLQVAPILGITLIILHFTDKETKAFKILFYTIGITIGIVLLRTIPVLFYDPRLLRSMLGIPDLEGSGSAGIMFLFDKIQLFNRFFPLSVMLISLGAFYFCMKTPFERFLFYFTAVTSLWWIFLYQLSTYRNPFMGFIPLSVIIAILLVRLFEGVQTGKYLPLKYITAAAAALFILYGFSTNLIYAYAGYNDGVQFDLDGNKNRLFSKVVYDNSQKEFYTEIKKMLRPLDTLYNGSVVTHAYLDNPVADVNKLKESISSNPSKKYLLITRDYYPLGLQTGRVILDSLGANWKLEYKDGEFELYGIKK